MMILYFFISVILFVLLTPGILVTLPRNSKRKEIVALTHGVIFGLIWTVICWTMHGIRLRVKYTNEGFQEGAETKKTDSKKVKSKSSKSSKDEDDEDDELTK